MPQLGKRKKDTHYFEATTRTGLKNFFRTFSAQALYAYRYIGRCPTLCANALSAQVR